MPETKRPNLRFEPNVTVGDLCILARLSDLHIRQGFSNAGIELRQQTGISADRIRDAMMRIDKAIGPIEKVANGRRSQQPSAVGDNMGNAGLLARLIIDIARDPATDQAKLSAQLGSILLALEGKFQRGDLEPDTPSVGQ